MRLVKQNKAKKTGSTPVFLFLEMV
jgi:hypothetical protein